MNKKINAICFIFLFLFLICSVSAADLENETIKTTQQDDLYQKIDNIEQTMQSTTLDKKLSEANVEKLELNNQTAKGICDGENKKLSQSQESSNTIKVTVKAPDVNMYYKDGSKFTVTLVSGKKVVANAKVKISINGKTYQKTTNTKGIVTLKLNLDSGTYSVLTSASENAGLISKDVKSTVKIKSTIKASNFKKIYKNSASYSAAFYDKKGALLKNTAIKFKLEGKTYSVKTNKKGVASLNVNSKPGKYTISIINPKTTETITKQITVTPLITENKDLTKYYKNTAEYKVKIIDSNGKAVSSGKSVSFKVNGMTYKKTTDKNGYAKINVNLNPGTYTIKATYGASSVKNIITIKSVLQTNDLTANESQNTAFNVKVLDSNGKTVKGKSVSFNLDNENYTAISNDKGIASLKINLDAGEYDIVTQYLGLKNTNKIIVNKIITPLSFSHIVQIPTYVNVTHPYVFEGTGYVLKSGINGIIKMPKYELITVNINDKDYSLSRNTISGENSIVMGYRYFLIPFDGSAVQSNLDKNNLIGDGIIISSKTDITEIEYRSTDKNTTQLFGFYADKGSGNSETFIYMEDEKVTAKINIKTIYYDEFGLKYSLSKFYGRSIYDFNSQNYEEYTYNNTDLIRFANTNKPVTFNYFGNSIVGYPSKEDINTKFIINGVEELEKPETISYGFAESYRKTLGFEVLQSYALINEKITSNILKKWVDANPGYLDRFGVRNVYGMFLTSLETVWLADEYANSYAKEFNVSWKRNTPSIILGGINLEDTYLNILNADMGMDVKGNENNTLLFRMLNSINLPYLEEYALSGVADRYMSNSSNSLENVFSAIAKNDFSIVEMGEFLYLFAEDGSDSAIILNTASGVANVIISHESCIYKGSSLSTACDCCSVGMLPKDIVEGISSLLDGFSPVTDFINDQLEKIHPFSILAYQTLKFGLGYILKGVPMLATQLFTMMTVVQTIGTNYKEKIVDKNDWHSIMDSVTFTRPGYLQSKKVYNIPNKNGGYDYIEVKIKDDLTLDRTNAIYISNGKTKTLTKDETYQYFDEEYWTPISMPTKYWDSSWKGVI